MKGWDLRIAEEVGQTIVRQRKFRNMTQEELASELGISRPKLVNFERGTQKISLGLFIHICVILQREPCIHTTVTVEWIEPEGILG